MRQLCHACVATVGFDHQAKLWGHCWEEVLHFEREHEDVLLEAGAMHACVFGWPQGSKSLSLQFSVSLILHLKWKYIVASSIHLGLSAV